MRAGAFSGAWLALVSRAEESGMESVKKIAMAQKPPIRTEKIQSGKLCAT